MFSSPLNPVKDGLNFGTNVIDPCFRYRRAMTDIPICQVIPTCPESTAAVLSNPGKFGNRFLSDTNGVPRLRCHTILSLE